MVSGTGKGIPTVTRKGDCVGDILVEVRRSGMKESMHRGSIAVVDRRGRIIASVGQPQMVTFMRSAAKPIQAVPVVESGAAARFGFTQGELAVMTASHSGEEIHTQAVAGILHKIGVGDDCLQCGVHPPYSKEAARILTEKREQPREIHCNCSGKHAAMLSLAIHLGYSVQNYRALHHPVQQLMLEEMSCFTGVDKEQITVGIDGCGVPVFGLPLDRMAYAFSQLAWGRELPPQKGESAQSIVEAMQSYPQMVAGKDRLCTDLLSRGGNRLVAKYGAESVYCIGHLPSGIGMAIKIEDGSERALGPAVVELLWKLGLLSYDDILALHHYHNPRIRNHRGEPVGELKAVFKLRKEQG